ncbi:MAG: response regulator [Gemmatimonadota bacterium]
MPKQPRTVLVVEDNADHALLMRLAARRIARDLDVRIASNGREAVAYLAGDPPFTDRSHHPFPSLVILDLGMPLLDGFGVLSWIREQDGLGELPVVVLTSSVNPTDQRRARQGGARAFFTKPANMDDLGRTVEEIVERWLP